MAYRTENLAQNKTFVSCFLELKDRVNSLTENPWRRRLDTVQTWKVFASTYPGCTDKDLSHRCHVIEKPIIPMEAYVKPLLSLSFHWIVHLTISNFLSCRAEIAGLSKLVNLGALTIGGSPTGTFLDDGIIRAWARAATEVGAFSMLRVLILKAQKEITPQCLAYLDQFPSLALFNTENCLLGPRTEAEALALGWKHRTGKDLTDFLIKGGLTDASWDSTVRALFRQAGAYNADHLGQESVDAIDSLPVLHFCLGRPPEEAALEITTNERMRCFQRISQKTLPCHNASVRRRSCDEQNSKNVPAKKPRVRISKLKSFEDLLVSFRP